jgi:hypothetical protein
MIGASQLVVTAQTKIDDVKGTGRIKGFLSIAEAEVKFVSTRRRKTRVNWDEVVVAISLRRTGRLDTARSTSLSAG